MSPTELIKKQAKEMQEVLAFQKAQEELFLKAKTRKVFYCFSKFSIIIAKLRWIKWSRR